jgi:uncharacterized protein YodC (DUF2158 family)
MADFNVGDVVILKSGGSRKTVESVKGDIVSCVWDDETKRPARSDYSSNILILVYSEISPPNKEESSLSKATKAEAEKLFDDLIPGER